MSVSCPLTQARFSSSMFGSEELSGYSFMDGWIPVTFKNTAIWLQIGYVAEEDLKKLLDSNLFYTQSLPTDLVYWQDLCQYIIFSLKMYIFILSYLPLRMLISTV